MKVYTTVPKVDTTADSTDQKMSVNQNVETIPVVGDEVLFGSYPQSLVTDNAITAELDKLAGKLPSVVMRRILRPRINHENWSSYDYYINSERQFFMWYIDVDYQQERYRGVYFTSYRPRRTDLESSMSNSEQDDNGYMTNVIYWFKYEPIRWRVVEVLQYGIATLVSDFALDNVHYDRYTCEFADSYIRQWLNKDFYSAAFDREQANAVLLTTVDNSESDGKDTQDKVYLLSQQEACEKYKLSAKTSTDYAKSQGVRLENGASPWWLRTKYRNSSIYTIYVYGRSSADIESTNVGVVPVVKIKL